jgi:hypothetical protein
MMASMLRALRLQELIVMEASEVLTLTRVLGAPAGERERERKRERERERDAGTSVGRACWCVSE